MPGIKQTVVILATAAVAVALLIGSADTVHARRGVDVRGGSFGVGLMLGGPSGLSAKYYLDQKIALAAGLGVFRGYWAEGTHFHLDVLWHPETLATTRHFDMPFYIGVGGRVLAHTYRYRDQNDFWFGENDTHLGVRAPAGLVMNFKRVPIDVFLEAALTLDLINGGTCYDDRMREYGCNHSFLTLHGALGARYFF